MSKATGDSVIKSMNTLAVGLAGCMLSIAYLLLIPFEVPFMESPFGVTSRSVPYLGGGLGLVVSFVLLVKAFNAKTRQADIPVLPDGATEKSPHGLRRVLYALVSFIAYFLALPVFGYAISTFTTVLVLFLIFSRDRLLLKVFLSVAFVAIMHVVFSELLNVSLPQSTLWGAN